MTNNNRGENQYRSYMSCDPISNKLIELLLVNSNSTLYPSFK
jgi:hypothetical protein